MPIKITSTSVKGLQQPLHQISIMLLIFPFYWIVIRKKQLTNCVLFCKSTYFW